ncbi:MAG: acetolactate synthase small subunit [Opitutaceae bacterium]
MPSPTTEITPARILEITVKNHPGVMSHVCGLFARRAYNVDGILCLPDPDRATSRIWLRLQEDERLDQIMRQIEKLVDVLSVREHEAGHDVFVRLEDFFRIRP